MFVLIDEGKVEIPAGWMLVGRGVVQAGDRTWNVESGEWHDEADDDYFGIGDDVRDFWCVIRRDPGAEG